MSVEGGECVECVEYNSGVRIILYDENIGYYSCELPDGRVVDVDNNGNYFDDEGNPRKVDGWNTLVCEYNKDKYNGRISGVLSDTDPQEENTDPQEENTDPQEENTDPQEGNHDSNQDNLYEDDDDDYEYDWQRRNNN